MAAATPRARHGRRSAVVVTPRERAPSPVAVPVAVPVAAVPAAAAGFRAWALRSLIVVLNVVAFQLFIKLASKVGSAQTQALAAAAEAVGVESAVCLVHLFTAPNPIVLLVSDCPFTLAGKAVAKIVVPRVVRLFMVRFSRALFYNALVETL